VRVLDSCIKPGETVPVHTHRWPSVLYILGTSDFLRYDTEGKAVFDSHTAASKVQTDAVVWSPPPAGAYQSRNQRKLPSLQLRLL